jgi:hypothetical protein
MTRRRPLKATLILATLTTGTLVPFGAVVADAAPIASRAALTPEKGPLPSAAPLVDANGIPDGCNTRAPLLRIVPQQGVNTIGVPDAEGCPASADIHWMSRASRMWQVMPDRTWREVFPRSVDWIEGSLNSPITGGGTGGETFISCPQFGLSGRVTLVSRITISARTAAHAPTTYSAQVDREQTVNCG